MGDTGYIYAVICAVMQTMQGAVVGACLERLLIGRDDKISKRKRAALWIALSCVILGFKCLVPLPEIYLMVGNPIVMSLWYVFFMKYCYSDKGKIKFVHAAMLVLQNILADIIYEITIGEPVLQMQHFPFEFRSMAIGCTIVAMLSVMMNIIYTVIMLKRQKKRHVKASPMWIANMLLLILIFVAMQVMGPDAHMDSYFVFICIFAIVEFSLLMLYLSQSEKQEEQLAKQKAQEEVSKLQQVMELEKVHYEQIEARREEMAKIRHDYNNVITSVLFLIENGKMDEAGNVIKDLSERMSRTREYPFCGIPIINAILTEKQKECEAEGISLTVDLLIPNTVTVVDLDLCMIFGNLMDNAIRSCKELRELGKVCSITLKAGMAQKYLIVKCQNTSVENREKKIKGTGYGHKILADIAGKYDGDFQTAYENGIFTAQISLKM